MAENRIKELRQKAGLSQVELARNARMASPNLSAIESGKMLAWPKVRRNLARALGVTQSELFPEEGRRNGI